MSTEPTAREQLVEALRPLLPPTWVVVPFSRNLDVISHPTVMVHASRIERSPAAPLSKHIVTFTVTVLDPQKDPTRGQGALDDEVNELIFALDQITFANFLSAEPSFVQDYLGWDVALEVITGKA
jgi:hypothetical protein